MSTKVNQLGKVQSAAGFAASAHHRTVRLGGPSVVTTNAPAEPTVKVVVLALVKCGAAARVRVNACVASGDTPFEAVKVSA